MKQCVAHPSLALLSVSCCLSLCFPSRKRLCACAWLCIGEYSFALSGRKDIGFGGPAAGELAKAEGVGQVRHICPSGGNATPK